MVFFALCCVWGWEFVEGADETCNAAQVTAVAISHSTHGVAWRSEKTATTRPGLELATLQKQMMPRVDPVTSGSNLIFFVLDRRWQHVTLTQMDGGACHPRFYELSSGRIPPRGSLSL